MPPIDPSEIATYRRLFDNKYREIEELLADLPAAALTWKPFEASPWKGPSGSLGWLIAHNISSTVYLLRQAEWVMGRIVWGDINGDEGDEEFGPANLDPAYLVARVERTQEWVHIFLDSLRPEDLEHGKPHPVNQRPITVRYDIQHAIEHMSQHNGHAQLTRQLWALA
ncbi:MAG: DinB family protein [Chloroflexi bacterium]|nr:DinB family protein [Chloroflexota bacterium]